MSLRASVSRAQRGRRVFRYGSVRTPLGRIVAVVGPCGLVAVDLVPTPLAALRSRLERALREPVVLERDDREPVLEQLAEYARGERRSFRVRLDWSLAGAARRGFRRRVLEELSKVRFGKTLSYGELARLAGNAGAARAVGTAMAKNPIPLVVPCHRVLASGGRLGGFSCGLALKRALLAHEGVRMPSSRDSG